MCLSDRELIWYMWDLSSVLNTAKIKQILDSKRMFQESKWTQRKEIWGTECEKSEMCQCEYEK